MTGSLPELHTKLKKTCETQPFMITVEYLPSAGPRGSMRRDAATIMDEPARLN